MQAFLDATGRTILLHEGTCPPGQWPDLPPAAPGFHRYSIALTLFHDRTEWSAYEREVLVPRAGEA